MARISNTNKYPPKNTPVGTDRVLITDSEDGNNTKQALLSNIVALALGGGGTDTFATLNGNIINFPDGQTIDVTPVVDTDTDTFATLAGTIITLPDGQTIDTTQGNAIINGNIITFGDGQTRDITPVVDTDTNTFAILSGGTITFQDGQTITIPASSTDDQTAAEVVINAIAGLTATDVQAALEQILAAIPTQTSQLTNNGNGTNAFITGQPRIDSVTLNSSTNILTLGRDDTSSITEDLSPLAGAANFYSTVRFNNTLDNNLTDIDTTLSIFSPIHVIEPPDGSLYIAVNTTTGFAVNLLNCQFTIIGSNQSPGDLYSNEILGIDVAKSTATYTVYTTDGNGFPTPNYTNNGSYRFDFWRKEITIPTNPLPQESGITNDYVTSDILGNLANTQNVPSTTVTLDNGAATFVTYSISRDKLAIRFFNLNSVVSGNTLFTLPVGHRVSQSQLQLVSNTGDGNLLRIRTGLTGTVVALNNTVGFAAGTIYFNM